MKKHSTKIVNLIVFIFVIITTISCSKDSDLLSQLMLEEAIVPIEEKDLVEETVDLEEGTVVTNEDSVVTIDISGTSISTTGKGSVILSLTQPLNGKTEIVDGIKIIYTPNKDFNGEDSFKFTVETTDKNNVVVNKEITLTISVSPVSDVVNDNVTIGNSDSIILDVLGNDKFENKEIVEIIATSTPTKGNVVINEDNTLTYTLISGLEGKDTFTYTVEVTNSDGSKTTETGIVTVNIGNNEPISGELKAFPTAYGAGAYTTGGRGGRVIFITNLNNSGEGSLRAALEATGSRIIIPRIAGIIKLTSMIYITNPASGNFTFAGQAAPDGGITITGDRIYYEKGVGNMIWRYVRIKGGGGSGDDSFTSTGMQNGIFDHVSFGFGRDEAASFVSYDDTRVENITVQNCLFSESKTGSIMGGNSVSNSNTGDISVLNNLYYNISHRFPNIQGNGNFEVINNVVWGWKTRLKSIYASPKVNNINNYHYSSPLNGIDMLKQGEKHGVQANSQFKVYTNGNVYSPLGVNPPEDQWTGIWSIYETYDQKNFPSHTQLPTSFHANSQFPLLGAEVSILSAQEALQNAPNNVGANARLNANGNIVPNLSQLDKEYLDNVSAGRYVIPRTDSQYNVPNFTGGSPYSDKDNDGMPDVWEEARGFDPNVDDSTLDNDGDGYTNIEEFLNLIDAAQ